MLHEQHRMLQSMFELNQKNQKELFEYRKKDLDERQMKLEKEEKIRKERERQRSIARRKIQNGSENQIEKMEHEQQQYPYYWVNPCNAIPCHCSGNPPAKWFEESGCFRCEKYKTIEKNVASTLLYVAYKNKCSSKMLSNPISLKNVPRIPKQQQFHPPRILSKLDPPNTLVNNR
ncbi:hypothetical protein DAPPUDRAFT_261202 [Daphnia pulex]|uniref:Uncharacterized protein n=1 Tax=Daphnia pulex TaxID=6669 RepID=E9HKP3_DAPPU|nr:hypothetical protein DAPPUDRAFT_261202 [Daphnia pulex]|eukprot:EFX67693.1 hypothetical protein DAPPUDRAFT_261202 [Daphnia pulex]